MTAFFFFAKEQTRKILCQIDFFSDAYFVSCCINMYRHLCSHFLILCYFVNLKLKRAPQNSSVVHLISD
jgi:hypothetical protein